MCGTERSLNPDSFRAVVAVALLALIVAGGMMALGLLKSISPRDYVERSPVELVVSAHGSIDDLDRRQREWRHENSELEVQRLLIDVPNQRITVYLKKPIVHKHQPTR